MEDTLITYPDDFDESDEWKEREADELEERELDRDWE
jgi:hypothetical protein